MGRVALALEQAAARVGALAPSLDEQGRRARAAVPRETLRPIAFDLADALQQDPGNADVLHNLSVLFSCAGDEGRARRARELAGK